jgi:hypothetical protein
MEGLKNAEAQSAVVKVGGKTVLDIINDSGYTKEWGIDVDNWWPIDTRDPEFDRLPVVENRSWVTDPGLWPMNFTY